MSKDPVALTAPDISVFARHVAQQLQAHGELPSHLTLMNMLARAAGFRNYQHLRAAHTARQRLADTPQLQNVDYKLVERALNQFNTTGHLQQWPSRRPVQALCLWALWADLPSATHLHEREVNAVLNTWHLFGDAPLIRRSLIGMGLLSRNNDGSDYQRCEKAPTAEAREVIQRVRERRKA